MAKVGGKEKEEKPHRLFITAKEGPMQACFFIICHTVAKQIVAHRLTQRPSPHKSKNCVTLFLLIIVCYSKKSHDFEETVGEQNVGKIFFTIDFSPNLESLLKLIYVKAHFKYEYI